jgi:hypothetical protein
MRWTLFLLSPILIITSSEFLFADPQPARTIKHPKSDCIVYSSAGEYPLYVVKKNGRAIYSPASDGIEKALFSPSGEYIAFSGSEIDWVDIGDKAFSIVVLKCSSGELKGFEKGYPGVETKWVDNMTLKYNDTASGKEITVKIIPKANNSFELTEPTPHGN